MIRGRSVSAAVFFIFCVVLTGTSAESMQRLISPEVLKQADLEILWETKLPIKMGENLDRLFIPFDCSHGRSGNRIYGLSDRNFMIGMNRETGNVIFKRSVAVAGLPVMGLELYEDELFSIIGDKLVEISLESGEERSAKRLGFGVTCPAARNISHFYVAGTDRRMHVLRSEDKVQAFEVAAGSDSVITSIVADENSVIFATAAGNVISVTPDKSKRLWQFDASGGIVGPIVRDGDALFAASGDTNIYRLNARTGKFVWKYQTGAKLEKGPKVTSGVVYQHVRNEGLVALDRENKKVLWQLTDGVDLLAEANGKAYVITKTGKLVVMDNKKAKQVCTVDMPDVSIYATNVADSKIYIADKSGRIACLQPIKY